MVCIHNGILFTLTKGVSAITYNYIITPGKYMLTEVIQAQNQTPEGSAVQSSEVEIMDAECRLGNTRKGEHGWETIKGQTVSTGKEE